MGGDGGGLLGGAEGAEAVGGGEDAGEQGGLAGGGGGVDGLRQNPPEGLVDLGLFAMRVVPAAEFLWAVAPAAAGEHFDDLDADVAFAGSREQGLGVASVVGVEADGGGEGEHDGVEVESVESLELDGGGEGAVAGDADVAGEALLAHFDEGFEPAAGLGDLVEFLEADDGVELEEIEGLHAEALLAGADVVPGFLAGAAAGLGADEPGFLPQARHPGGHVFHGVAVGGGDVEVVDAGGEGEFHGLVHLGLGQVLAAKAGGAEGDDGAVVVYASELASLHGWGSRRGGLWVSVVGGG